MVQHGFKKVITALVKANPGLTAREYAKMALSQRLAGSDARDPVFSLASTLAKEVREGRMESIKASATKPVRYYPDERSPKPVGKPNDPITVVAPADLSDTLNVFVEAGKFETRGEALMWLASAGTRLTVAELKQAKLVVKQIRRLKRSLQANPPTA